MGMMKINVVRNGPFLVAKSTWTEYLKSHPVYTERLETKVSPNTSIPEFVTNSRNYNRASADRVNVPLPSQVREDLVRVLGSGKKQSWRILEYLAAAKSKEPQITLQDDIELAWFTVLRASEGYPDPWNFSFWMLYGKTYARAMKAWAERDKQNEKELAKCAAIAAAEKEQANLPCGSVEGTPESPLRGRSKTRGLYVPRADEVKPSSCVGEHVLGDEGDDVARIAGDGTKPIPHGLNISASPSRGGVPFTPSFLRTEKTPATEMVGSNPADNGKKDKTAPVLNLYDSARQIVKKSPQSASKRKGAA